MTNRDGKARCVRCGRRVGWIRLLPRDLELCDECEAEDADAATRRLQEESEARRRADVVRQEARQEYAATAALVADGSVSAAEIARRLSMLANTADITPEQDHTNRLIAIARYFDRALADERLTNGELGRLNDLTAALGVDYEELFTTNPSLGPSYITARVNAGYLGVAANAPLLLKSGEEAYLSCGALLLKEQITRGWVAGSAGVSVRLMRGVSVRIGSTRGHSVGMESVAIDDQGDLVVTSARAVFVGSRRAVEMPFARLLEVRMFEDGLTFHLSNRAKSPRFAVASGWGEPVAATTLAAASRTRP